MENQHKIIKNNVDEFTPEFSRIITISEIQGKFLSRDIKANEEERNKLATRFNLIELRSFSANVKMTRLNSHANVLVEGKLNARVVQQCVVTLEPISSDISCTLSCEYSESQEVVDDVKVDFDLLTVDPPELIVDGQFDIGILLTEYFGLEINPFPRSLGADYDAMHDTNKMNKIDLGRSNPFDILRKLK